MALFTKLGKEINRPVDAFGDQRVASMADEARWKTEAERFIAAATGTPSLIFDDKTVLDASLNYPANTFAWVIGDSTAANNGVYSKIGASGAGSWTRLGDLPYSFISALNSGAGTADAILADTDIAPPSAAYGAMFLMNVTTANTGAVTVSLNGGTAKPLKTNIGSDLDAGYLVSGMLVAFVNDGTNYRMISDPDSAANLAAAEAAKDTAVAAAATASAAATTATTAANTATTAAEASANSVGAMIFDFDSGTSDADPGDGEFALNNADPALATEMYIDVLDNAGVDVSAWIETWDDSSNTAKGVLTIRSRASSAIFRIYNVTGSVVTASTYRKVTIAHVSGSGTLSGECAISFARAGNAGAAGSGTGDMLEATYDPNGYGADAFSMGNMQETSTAKILTATERTTIGEVRRDTPTPPTFAYRFKEGQPLPSAFSFTRDSTALTQARNALLSSVSANSIRHSYSVDGAYRGVLINQALENRLTYSDDLSNAAWNPVRIDFGAAIQSPLAGDTTSAVKLIPSTSNGLHYFYQELSYTSGDNVCRGFFAKAGEYDKFRAYFGSNAFTSNGDDITVNLTTGTITDEGADIVDSNIWPLADNWYFISVSAAAAATDTGYLMIRIQDEGGNETYAGDGTKGLYFWRMVEVLDRIEIAPEEAVGTTASAVTRPADALTADIDDIGFNANEGTFFWRGSIDAFDGKRQGLLFARESAGAGIALFYHSGDFVIMKRDGGGSTLAEFAYSPSLGEEVSVAAYWTDAEIGISVNGGAAVVEAATETPTPTALWIGKGTGIGTGADNLAQNGPTREFAVWDRALPSEITVIAARGPVIGETLYAPEIMKRVGLPISGLLGSGEGVATNLQAVLDGAPNGSTFIFEDAVDWGSTRPSSPYITLPRKVRLEWKQPWDLTGFASTTSSPIILQRGGELTGSTIDLDGTPSLTKGSTDRVTVASGQGSNFAVGERWLLHATASLTTLTGAFTLLDSAGSPYYNRRCESVWVERVEGDVVYFTKPISDDYPNSCDPRLIKYDDDIDIELINPMVDAFTPYVDSDEGGWVTSTSYSVGDHVIESNRGYVCLIAHTSGTFATDLAAAKWVDMGSDRFLDVTLARRLRIIGGRARRLSGMFARISGVADLEIDGLRGDMNDKGSAAPGGFLFVGGDTDGARFRNLDVTGGGQPFMQSSTGGHYGVMRNSLWENCISRGSLNGAFSQHNIEERTTYRNCKVIDCNGPAFDVRTRGNRMHNCEAIRCGTVLYLRNVVDDFEIDGLTAKSCLSGLRLTTFSGAHEVTPGSIDIRNVSMRDIGGTGSVGALSMEYGYDVSLGRLAVENFNAAMNNATIAITISGRWNRPELKNVSIHGTSGTGRPIYMHDAGLGAAKGPYAPTVNGLTYSSTYAAPLVQNLGGVPAWKNQTVINGGANTITISSGGALTTLFADAYIVSANSGTTDNLDTMPTMADGTRRTLRGASGHTITVRDVGNIILRGGASSTAITSATIITLEAIGSNWHEV